MTVAQQVAHTAQTIDRSIQGDIPARRIRPRFRESRHGAGSVTSLAAARQALETAYANAIGFLRSSSPEDLARQLPPGPVMGGQPISDIVWGIVEHTAHHRGALTVYSRQLGKVPPMPYGG